MTRMARLRDLASARAGDKGDTASIAVIADSREAYAAIKSQLTPERLRAEFPDRFRGPVRRFELPALMALNFVAERALDGGVNASVNLDAHGMALSYLLVGLEIVVPD
ncbi:MAG: hypothetical protein VX463_20030 [Pseudomonadota bacterium]|nr:hypothetical protein [Pseudomonadota bacterium]